MTEEKKSQGKPKRIHTYGKRDTHAEEMPIFEFQIFKMRNNDIWKIRNNNSNNKLANYTGFSIIWNHPLDQCLSAAHCTKFSVLHFQAPVFSVAYLVLSRSMRWPVFIIIFYIIIYIFRFVIVICSMICCVCVCLHCLHGVCRSVVNDMMEMQEREWTGTMERETASFSSNCFTITNYKSRYLFDRISCRCRKREMQTEHTLFSTSV